MGSPRAGDSITQSLAHSDNFSLRHVFGLMEETGEPRGNVLKLENLQLPNSHPPATSSENHTMANYWETRPLSQPAAFVQTASHNTLEGKH